MKKTLVFLSLILTLGLAGEAGATTFTFTQTKTLTPSRTPTQTLTATTSLRTVDLEEYDVVNASASGVTVTALPAGWTNYRVTVDPVDLVLGNTTNSLRWYAIRRVSAVEIHVVTSGGLKTNLLSRPIRFSLIAIRKNND